MWKPLPSLPVQDNSVLRPSASRNVSSSRMVTDVKRKGHQESQSSVSSPPHSTTLGASDKWLLSALTFDSPPPTPESEADSPAREKSEERPSEAKSSGIDRQPSLQPASPSPSDVRPETRVRGRGEVAGHVHHTREERIWLHVNYRGEAPFLQAWGLDITKLEDRLQGLAIVKELMNAERRDAGVQAMDTVV